MKSLPFILAALFACSIVLNVSSGEKGILDDLFIYDVENGPENLHSIGNLFELHSTHNETRTEDQLRLTSGYIKQTLTMNSLGSKIPVGHLKLAGAEDLLPCDKLSIVRPELKQHIDCKPIAGHIIDDTFDSISVDKKAASEPNKLFVRQFTLKLKSKYNYQINLGSKDELSLYPLKKDYVLKEILSKGKECDINDVNFFKNNLNLGHYFEFYGKIKDGKKTSFRCTGNSFLSVNRTQLLARYKHETFPEFLDEIDYLIRQSWRNGYLLSLNNVECNKEEFLPFSVNTNFTIVQRKQFPYLAVRHHIETAPFSILFNFNSTVDQTILPEFDDPFHYNTTVEIDSSLPLANWLSFKLKQVFVNNGTERFEDMYLIMPPKNLLKVYGAYNQTLNVKQAIYYEVLKKGNGLIGKGLEAAEEKLKEIFSIAYLDSNEEKATIQISLDKKKLINTFMPLLESLFSFKEKDLPAKETESSENDSKETTFFSDEL